MRASPILLAFSVGLIGCPVPRTAADWPDDPTTPADVQTACAAAGTRLHTLQCKEDRADFTTFCTTTIGNGAPLHPQCLAKIETCADVDSKCR
jgi:hypothetical protein